MEMRSILAIVLSIIVLAGYQYFFVKTPPPSLDSNVTQTNSTHAAEKPAVTTPNTEGNASRHSRHPEETPASPALSVPTALPAGVTPRDITVETGLYKMVFSEMGAGLKQCLLKAYRVSLSPDSPYQDLVKVKPPRLPLVLGLGEAGNIDLSTCYFKANKDAIKLNDGQDKASLTFTARLGNGTRVTKTFIFHKNTYWVDMKVAVNGTTSTSTSLYLYNRPYQPKSRYIFSGPSYYGQDGRKEIKLDPGETESYTGTLDWVAYGDNYFMTAVIPMAPKGPWGIHAEKKDKSGLTAIRVTDLRPVSGSSATGMRNLDVGLYFGPKEIDRLKALGHNLSKAINFGWFDPIAKPLLYLLKIFYRVVHNYGVAIIVLTVLIKLAFWPLAHKSARSMKTMQKLQPKMAKLKEKYGDDKERLNKELMQLYRTYKVNPMSGCLPMLFQIPVFFALYRVLLRAIELRHAPFALWINDLSAPDRLMIGVHIPYLGGIPVLTLLMGVSMYFQQKMSPSSLDPTQAKMMQMLPIVFTFMFINFPSGLVLYWLVNNILSIVQQYYVNKFTD